MAVWNTIFVRILVAAPLVLWADFLRDNNLSLSSHLGLSGWQEILASLVVLDLFDYWWHRFNHTVPFLWRFHRVHHLDTHVDVTTSLRFHIGELLLSGVAKALWILMWGPSALAFAIFETAITAYSQFHHSNIDFPDRVERLVRWIHMTPRLHAGHHTVSLRTRDANFSTIFLVWDRLFKTLREPETSEMKLLGLPEGREGYLSFWRMLKAPFTS
jgi:sterol desaturase/sphingolipid hydroxylase (fatty acid hydroxylase superfamily)